MPKRYVLIFALVAPLWAAASALTGSWSGSIDARPGVSLRIVFNIHGDTVTLDSPDQNARGIKCYVSHLSADSINVRVVNLGVKYAGRLRGDSIVGVFKQGMFKAPLVLKPGVKKLNRPQTPQGPFPYATEDVVIDAPAARLAGTLSIPEGATDSTPVLVLVSGSGRQNRDEELFEHKPFAVIADYLARRGIATLRYDDRGFGESTGDVSSATTADYADDARAVAEWLRASGRFGRVGLLGHSEGGMIGYMLGATPGVLDFVVSVAGPAVKGSEIVTYQRYQALLEQGLEEGEARRLAPEVPKEALNPWIEYFLASDPAAYLQSLTVPTLIIYGGKDCQVPPSLNESPARAAAPGAEVRVYPNLNHMMQHATTGKVTEYKEIEETIAPEVLGDIVEFVKSLDK